MAKFAEIDVFVLTASESKFLQVLLKMFINISRDFQDVDDVLTQEAVAEIKALFNRIDQMKLDQ